MYFQQALCLSLVIVAGFAAQNASAQTLRFNDGATVSTAFSGYVDVVQQ